MSTASRIAADAVADLRHQPLVGAAHGGDDAELGGTGGRGLLGGLDQLRDVQPHRAHRRGELAGLAAEVAVLGAAAGLEADDPLDLDLGAAVLHPDLVGKVEQLGDLVVGQLQHLDELVVRQALAAVEDLAAGSLEDVRHAQQDSPSDGPVLPRPRPLDRPVRRPVRLRRLAPMPQPMSQRTPEELLAFDREHVWHPYTSMTDPAPTRLVTGAAGVRLELADGRG